ncbi:hypothetical protein NC653_038714 [Populus alba x Populus x berolinensis]|uniref:Uncharacterized protein n=1 Tax=Populus alba x Populus x berolinensis TaxID=444605 RepID=A0AAD6PTR0_9ROSI|nr:hypothetical protein NC653_038714 [Populus alba x Populus x berolinensis]
MSHSSLHCKLREILMGNKLFLVLGDFWNDDPEQSKFLITPLMGGAKEHGVVHISWSLDHLYAHRFHVMAPCSFHLWLFSWDGLDYCPFLSFR